MTAPPIDAVLAGIRAAVEELIDDGGLIDQLADHLSERGQGPDVVTGRRPPGSKPPWDPAVAAAALAIHAAARDLEAELFSYAFGTYRRRTAGSDGNTRMALRRVVDLAWHEKVPEYVVRRTAQLLGRLVRQAQAVPAIDLAPAPPMPLIRPCPYCGGRLEAALDGSTEVACVTPTCRDDQGRRRRWPKHLWPMLLDRLAGA